MPAHPSASQAPLGRSGQAFPALSSRDRPPQAGQLVLDAGLELSGSGRGIGCFGVGIATMTAWRDVQAQANLPKQKRTWQKVRVLGVDGAWVQGWGKKRGV